MREFELLKHVYGGNVTLPPRVTIPPGDDMGAVRVRGVDVLVTVDQLADGVHFGLATTPLEKVARKAITRNLSDVAAMAAIPAGAVVAASLPRDFGDERATRLFDLMREAARSFGCPLFGGDISIWSHPLLLTVTVIAEAGGIPPVLRRGARVGDEIYVTGSLGGSLETVDGYTHHLDFEPRLRTARFLGQHFRPTCMIDLSDGLSRDLGHLCDAGNVSAEVEAALLPISAGARQASQRDGTPSWRHAVADGEDYELCFCASPRLQLPADIEGVSVTRIGRIAPRSAEARITLILPDGARQCIDDLGWEHAG